VHKERVGYTGGEEKISLNKTLEYIIISDLFYGIHLILANQIPPSTKYIP